MPSAKAILLAVEVQTRLGGASSRRLIELTNDDATATTINTDVLYSACDDALGDFRTGATVEPDLDIASHVVALFAGVVYYLEFYKGRNVGSLKIHENKFYAKLHDFIQKKTHLARSNSVLQQSTETNNALPDMDRARRVWKAGRSYQIKPEETATYEN